MHSLRTLQTVLAMSGHYKVCAPMDSYIRIERTLHVSLSTDSKAECNSFRDCIITDDEIWHYHSELELKCLFAVLTTSPFPSKKQIMLKT